MEWYEILKVFGLPTLFLGVVSLAAWKWIAALTKTITAKDTQLLTQEKAHKKALLDQEKDHKLELIAQEQSHRAELAEKDVEIKRLNDARLAETGAQHERMLTTSTQSTELVGDTNKTLEALATRIGEWREEIKALLHEIRGWRPERDR